MRRYALLLALLSSCGSLVENETKRADGGDSEMRIDGGNPGPTDGGSELGTDAGNPRGLFCASEDPCGCTPCTSTAQCATGLSCIVAHRRSMNCPDNRLVCTEL